VRRQPDPDESQSSNETDCDHPPCFDCHKLSSWVNGSSGRGVFTVPGQARFDQFVSMKHAARVQSRSARSLRCNSTPTGEVVQRSRVCSSVGGRRCGPGGGQCQARARSYRGRVRETKGGRSARHLKAGRQAMRTVSDGGAVGRSCPSGSTLRATRETIHVAARPRTTSLRPMVFGRVCYPAANAGEGHRRKQRPIP